MRQLTDEGQRALGEIAIRHGVSLDAAQHLLLAVMAGHTNQAQFNHPELGGMGQWSQGGMIMVGDMFNNGLKAKVDALCSDLAELLQKTSPLAADLSSPSKSQPSGEAGGRWPASLGSPASTGSQNDMHYAVFPGTRRLAIAKGGEVRIYDTGEHKITGYSQQQGGGQSLTFKSQHGLVRIDELESVSVEEPSDTGTTVAPAAQAVAASGSDDDVFVKLEKLAALRDKSVITDEEFAAKKAELMAQL